MSDKVSAWVKEFGPVTQPDYGVLREIADHAGARGGVDTAHAWPGVALLARESRWERKTVMKAIERLERDGYLLVRRPADRGHGKHSEYIVVMDRDPAILAAALGWPDRSVPRTDAEPSASVGAPPPNARLSAKDPHRGALDGHRADQAAPPAPCPTTNQEPVDSPTEPITASVPQTDRSPTDRSRTGPGPVPPSAPESLKSEVLNPSHLESAHQTQPGHARDTGSVVDNGFFDTLREALVGLAPDITFDLPEARVVQLLEHAAAWPTQADAVDAFAAASRELVAQYGVPRSARAWIPGWLATTPPPVTADEPMCDEHPLGDIPVPKRACAICRARDIADHRVRERT